MTSPPTRNAATPSALAQTAPPIPPAFTSSFSAFNLSARHNPDPIAFLPPSPMQMDGNGHYDVLGTSQGQGAPFGRKLSSKLGSEMMIPLGSQEALDSPRNHQEGTEEGQDGVGGAEGEGDSMVLGSPTFEQRSLPNLSMGLPAPTSNYWATSSEGRSRSASVSMRDPASVPASPVALSSIARAAVQRTPPPFLQRRLFNGDEDVGSTSSSSSGREMKIIDSEEDFEVALDEAGGEAEIDSVGLGLSSTNERVVRRPVSRRPNLLPKPKSHLRVLSQLRAEDGPADSLEIASEATLHRLSRSCASTVPIIRPTTGTPINPNSSGDARPSSSSGGLSHSKPTPNRFPEQAEDEEEKRDESEGSGEGEAEEGSEFGGMSMGYTTEDEDEQRKSVMWTGIRGGSNGGNGNFGIGAGPSSVRGSPSSERGKMEMDYNSPSTPGWQNSARPGKRKLTEERFDRYEPSNYSKRRAISPAPGISSTLGSPILSHAQPLPLPTPPPIPSSLILSTSLPITIPSPTFAHHSFFSSLNHRRGSIGTASSPGHYSRPASPAPSSLSSSAGGRGNNFATQNSSMIMGLMSGRAEREEERTNGGSKMGETGDGLGRMKLD